MRRINWTARRRVVLLGCLAALSVGLSSFGGRPAPPPDDRLAHPACRHCGMDRNRFAHSRVLITYADGGVSGVCSLHCAALDLALHLGMAFRQIQVADYHTRELVDAENAHWILGGRVSGVMTHRAKWAFATQESAEQFIRKDGGELTDFAGALKAAYQDMYVFVLSRAKRPAGT